MIESKTLGSAAGIQYQGVIDKTETASLPALANGVVIGKFKRGRMDKPFKVTASNYQALLGRDPSNPSYLAVEDCFKRGVSEVSVLRVDSSLGKSQPSDGSGGDTAVSNSSLIFSVESYESPTNSYPLYIYLDTPVGEWSLKESGVVIADSTGFHEDYLALDIYDGGVDMYLRINTPETKRYELDATAQYIDVSYDDYYYNGTNLSSESETPLGEVIITQFSSKAPEFTTGLTNTLLTVPDVLPPELANLDSLFTRAKFFNQDISMWDVSNVINMDGTFAGAPAFNQDLSQWCVTRITEEPVNFSSESASWTLPKPVWGTCPRGEAAPL